MKRYVKAFCQKKTFDNGGSILNVSINLADINQLKVDAKGYVRVVIAEKQTVGEYGDTHYMYESEYVPKPKTAYAPKPRIFEENPSTQEVSPEILASQINDLPF